MTSQFISQLSPQLIAEAMKQSHDFWGGGLTLEARTTRFLKFAQKYPQHLKMSGMVNDRGELTSSYKRYRFEMTWHQKKKSVLGIGAVFTRSDLRGQSGAKILLKHACQEAANEGFELAVLYSDIDPAYYESLGFTRLPAVDWLAQTSQLPKSNRLRTRAATANDLKQCLSWYESSFPPNWQRIARDETTWNLYRERVQTPNDLILVDGFRDAGFLNVEIEKKQLWVNEWAIDESYQDAIWSTIRQIAEDRQLSEVSGWLKPNQYNCGFQYIPRNKAIPMILSLSDSFSTTDLDSLDPIYFGPIDHF